MLKRILTLLTALALLLGCACAAAETDAADTAHQIEMKNTPLYIMSPEYQLPGGFPLYFADGAEDLAYVDLSDWANIMNMAFPDPTTHRFDGFQVTTEVDETGHVVTLVRENGHMIVVDFENSREDILKEVAALCEKFPIYK